MFQSGKTFAPPHPTPESECLLKSAARVSPAVFGILEKIKGGPDDCLVVS